MDPIEEQSVEESKWYAPMKIIVGLFLLLLLIFMVVPYYGLKLDPAPRGEYPSIVIMDNNFSTLANINSVKSLTVSQTIRNNAVKITTEMCDQSRTCSAKALFNFVQNKIEYTQDPRREYVQHPVETLYSRGGDCEDKAILLANMLMGVGFKTRLVLTFDHAYLQVWIPEALQKYKFQDDWINLDTTCEYCEFGQIPIKYADIDHKYIFLD